MYIAYQRTSKKAIYQLLSGGFGDGENAHQLSPACGRLSSPQIFISSIKGNIWIMKNRRPYPVTRSCCRSPASHLCIKTSAQGPGTPTPPYRTPQPHPWTPPAPGRRAHRQDQRKPCQANIKTAFSRFLQGKARPLPALGKLNISKHWPLAPEKPFLSPWMSCLMSCFFAVCLTEALGWASLTFGRLESQ